MAEDEGVGDPETFLTIQEAFVLHKAPVPAASAKSAVPLEGPTCTTQEEEEDTRVACYQQAWDRITATVQAELAQLHQPFYEAVAERVSSVHFDSRLSYGPPDALEEGPSSDSPLHPAALAALRPFQTLQRRLYTGLLLLQDVNSADYSGPLHGLAASLRQHGCQVAHLHLATMGRKGANSVLRSLVKQLVKVDLEVAEVGVLRAWHQQAGHAEQPTVVLLEEADQAEPALLENLVLTLSEWHAEVPLLLLLPVASHPASLHRLLPAAALALLRTEVFPLPPSLERLHAGVGTLLFRGDLGFTLAPAAVQWLYAHFFTGHATLTSFLAGLRVLLLHRCATQPLSCLDRHAGERAALEGALRAMPAGRLRAAAQSRTAGLSEGASKAALAKQVADTIMGAWEHRRDCMAALQVLHLACQAGGLTAVSLPELHYWSAHPAFFEDAPRRAASSASPLALFGCSLAPSDPAAVQGQGHRLVSAATRAIHALPADALQRLVHQWRTACSSNTPHLQQVLSELLPLASNGEPPSSPSRQAPAPSGAAPSGAAPSVRSSPRRPAGAAHGSRLVAEARGVVRGDAQRMAMMHRGQSAAERRRQGLSAPTLQQTPGDPVKDRLGAVLRRMIEGVNAESRRCIQASAPTAGEDLATITDCSPLEQALCCPLHVHVCQALTSPATVRPCACCSSAPNSSAAKDDTATAYRLCTALGEHVNLPEWYDAFVAAVAPPALAGASEAQPAAGPAKGPFGNEPPLSVREFPVERVRERGRPRKRPRPAERQEGGNQTEEAPAEPSTEQERATLQARFFQATAELQLCGLIRASARKPEHVQRL